MIPGRHKSINHIVFQYLHIRHKLWGGPPSARVPLDPLFAQTIKHFLTGEGRAGRGPGGRPTIYAGVRKWKNYVHYADWWRLARPFSAADKPRSLLVFLTDYSVQLKTAARQESLRGKRGQFLWHAGGEISLENLSEHPLDIAHVGPKFSPTPEPWPPGLNPRNVVFENDLVRVRRLELARDLFYGRRLLDLKRRQNTFFRR